jgi:hypothetical protein
MERACPLLCPKAATETNPKAKAPAIRTLPFKPIINLNPFRQLAALLTS